MNLRQKDRIGFRQVVPDEWCFSCDVCCRFPEKDSFLAPCFTQDEMNAAREKNPPLPPFNSCKITLTPYKEGFICPAFDPTAAHCKIYDIRPVDCMLYPFAIMWDAAGQEIVLGIDTKCPYVRKHQEDSLIKEASGEIADAIESPPLLDILSTNKGLIGPYQDDVIPVVALKTLTSKF